MLLGSKENPSKIKRKKKKLFICLLKATAAISCFFPHCQVTTSHGNCPGVVRNFWLTCCNILYHLSTTQTTLCPKDLDVNPLEPLKALLILCSHILWTGKKYFSSYGAGGGVPSDFWLALRSVLLFEFSCHQWPAEWRAHTLFSLQGWQQFLVKPEAEKPAQEAMQTERWLEMAIVRMRFHKQLHPLTTSCSCKGHHLYPWRHSS